MNVNVTCIRIGTIHWTFPSALTLKQPKTFFWQFETYIVAFTLKLTLNCTTRLSHYHAIKFPCCGHTGNTNIYVMLYADVVCCRYLIRLLKGGSGGGGGLTDVICKINITPAAGEGQEQIGNCAKNEKTDSKLFDVLILFSSAGHHSHFGADYPIPIKFC